MLSILRALRDAQAKTRATAERARIQGAMLQVGERPERLATALNRVASMRKRQKSYESRISDLGNRIPTAGRAQLSGHRALAAPMEEPLVEATEYLSHHTEKRSVVA
jgi:hypothetical protein